MELILGVLYILVIGAVTVSMAVLLLKGQRNKANYQYVGCQTMVVLWCVSQILILLSHTTGQLTGSYLVGNIGICFVGAFWLHFAITYSEVRLPRVVRILPYILSAFHYCMVLSNPWHHLYYSSFMKDAVTHGIFFYTNVAATYLFVVLGAVLLYRSVHKKNRQNAAARGLIITAVLVPVLFNAVYLTGLVQSAFDITPLGFGISGILVLIATFRYRFMDVNGTAFGDILSGLQDGVCVFDQEGRATFVNDRFADWMGISTEDVIALTEWLQVLSKMERIHVSECDGDRNAILKETYCDSNGRFLQIQQYEQQRTIAFVVQDVSEYYELVNRTKELAVSKEKLALEKERNRIAQQVHDTAGHTLTMLQSYMKLAIVSNEHNRQGEVTGYLEEARKLASEGIRELRISINQLRQEEEAPMVTQGILQLANRVKEIPVEVTVRGEDREEYSHLGRICYDCVRESITNTLKYAHASKIDIVIRFLKDRLELMIADDGDGCDTITDNNGLRGIRERVEKAGGSVHFTSEKGQGFLTVVKIPYEQAG